MEFKYNQKIPIPKTKSVGSSMEKSVNIRMARGLHQDFLYFKYKRDENYVLSSFKDSGGGDFFSLEDIAIRQNKTGW